MNLAMSRLEKSFMSSFQGVHLPPTWQVIYQEGVRSNHILFSASDVHLFMTGSDLTKYLITPDTTKKLETVGYKILTASTYKSMYEIIAECDFEMRKHLFLIYQRLLSLWAIYLKKSLH